MISLRSAGQVFHIIPISVILKGRSIKGPIHPRSQNQLVAKLGSNSAFSGFKVCEDFIGPCHLSWSRTCFFLSSVPTVGLLRREEARISRLICEFSAVAKQSPSNLCGLKLRTFPTSQSVGG